MAFKWVWKQLKGYRLLMLLGMVMVVGFSALSMVNPFLSGFIVDRVIGDKNTGLLPGLLMFMVAVTLGRAIIKYLYQVIFEHVSQSVLFNVRVKLYNRLQTLDFNFFDRTRTGDIMARITGDTDMVRHFAAFVVPNLFENGVVFIFAISMLFSTNWKLALALLAITPITGYLTFRLAVDVKPTFFGVREQFSKLNSIVQENISGNRVVKAFAKEDYEIDKFSKENAGYRQKNIESAAVWEKYLPVLDSLAGVLTVIMILVGGAMVVRGTMSVGQLVTFNGFVWALNNPMRMAGWLINDVQRFATSGEKVISLLETETSISNSDKAVTKERLLGMVEFRNVSFSYGDEKVLESISLKAKPGQTIAVIGPTGAGKSTLVSLISRFYDCTSGEILIDGVNIRDIELQTLRRNVSVAMQDIFLFSDTIEGNVSYGVPQAPMEEVEWAAGVADAHEFILRFTEGYDTIVGERGVGLSGGQKQRIALARALIKNPSVLILDDTTSSVDIETEHEIHKTLRSFYNDKTTFIIAHRISSVKNADMILVLEDGKIVEQGRHQELLDKKGYYYSVYVNQVGDFDNTCEAEVI
jgi:ATP-binding cassette, subfamily B, multidrug efflux pump